MNKLTQEEKNLIFMVLFYIKKEVKQSDFNSEIVALCEDIKECIQSDNIGHITQKDYKQLKNELEKLDLPKKLKEKIKEIETLLLPQEITSGGFFIQKLSSKIISNNLSHKISKYQHQTRYSNMFKYYMSYTFSFVFCYFPTKKT